jgi:hypothetical protein
MCKLMLAGIRERFTNGGQRSAFSVVILVAAALVAMSQSGLASPVPVARIAYETPIGGAAYDITVDPTDGRLWFALMGPASKMVGLDPTSHWASEWKLPPTEHNGFLEVVVVAPDGAIWITQEYVIVRLDPSTGTVQSVVLAREDGDATSDALTDASTSPGTWPSGIAFRSDGSAFVIRHNVSSALVLNSNLEIKGRVGLPAGLDRPGEIVSLGESLVVSSYHGDGPAFVIDHDGHVLRQLGDGLHHIGAAKTSFVATSRTGVVGFDAAYQGRHLLSGADPLDRIAIGDDGEVYLYQHAAGRILQLGSDGTSLAEYRLGVHEVAVVDPLGNEQLVVQVDEVGDLAVDQTGALWYSDISGNRLVELRF